MQGLTKNKAIRFLVIVLFAYVLISCESPGNVEQVDLRSKTNSEVLSIAGDLALQNTYESGFGLANEFTIHEIEVEFPGCQNQRRIFDGPSFNAEFLREECLDIQARNQFRILKVTVSDEELVIHDGKDKWHPNPDTPYYYQLIDNTLYIGIRDASAADSVGTTFHASTMGKDYSVSSAIQVIRGEDRQVCGTLNDPAQQSDGTIVVHLQTPESSEKYQLFDLLPQHINNPVGTSSYTWLDEQTIEIRITENELEQAAAYGLQLKHLASDNLCNVALTVNFDDRLVIPDALPNMGTCTEETRDLQECQPKVAFFLDISVDGQSRVDENGNFTLYEGEDFRLELGYLELGKSERSRYGMYSVYAEADTNQPDLLSTESSFSSHFPSFYLTTPDGGRSLAYEALMSPQDNISGFDPEGKSHFVFAAISPSLGKSPFNSMNWGVDREGTSFFSELIKKKEGGLVLAINLKASRSSEEELVFSLKVPSKAHYPFENVNFGARDENNSPIETSWDLIKLGHNHPVGGSLPAVLRGQVLPQP